MSKEIAAVVIQTAEPVQNDSSEGLARMCADLEPLARRLRSNACTLLLLSMLFCGTAEGLFGMMAAFGVLCCAAPGPLGTAHAARCTRILAIFCASFAFFHMTFLATFSMAVLPEMPAAVEAQCAHPADQPPVAVITMTALVGKDGHGLAPEPKHLLGEDGHGQLKMAKEPKHLLGEDGHGQLHQPLLGEDPATYAPEPKHLLGEDGHGQYNPGLTEVFTVKVADLSTKLSRRLEQALVDPEEASSMDSHCEKVAAFYRNTAPTALLCTAIVEFCIFLSALMTSVSAGRLTLAARKYGANGI